VKAIRYRAYGPPTTLVLEDVDRPVVGDGELLVRVRAASVNPLDWHYMRGTPYFLRAMAGLSRPRAHGLGVDFAGLVEAVGGSATGLRPGDEVFGAGAGAFAEYVAVREDGAVLRKSPNVTFEQAAAVPVAGITALQAVRDKGRVRPGQAVLVNGAAGGVGTFAVQIAKAFGAEVTAVCSTRNVEMVRSLVADQVIDYTQEDLTRTGRRYDVILDVAASRTLAEMRGMLAPRGVLVGIGAANPKGNWVGPLLRPLAMAVLSPLGRRRLSFFVARMRREDLAVLHALVERGKVTPVIDRTYPLSEVPEAIAYLEQGHARGKVVITA
jgi:NADPH:quinone reductase-like Zn-dependent oxidoreductase